MVLSDRSIKEALDAGRIIIDPLGEDCIQPSSVDLHVDQYFRVFRNHTARVIDVREDQEELTELVDVGARRVPSSCTPASSSSARRSSASRCPTTSWLASRASRRSGRLGLLIHSTAGFVDAGWDGHLTLELSNVANLPITLYPGMKIGQISFFQMTTAAERPYGSEGLGVEVPRPVGPDPQPLRRQLPQGRRPGLRPATAHERTQEAQWPFESSSALGISVVCFAIAGRRFYWLSKLIRSGQPAKRPFQGFSKAAEAEVVEVAGQKKLLKWTVPGLAHFFTMWGFTVLLLTIIEAYGALFEPRLRHPAHRPLVGHRLHRGLLRRRRAGLADRLHHHPAGQLTQAQAAREPLLRLATPVRPGWCSLFISLVIITLLGYRAAQEKTGHFPFQARLRWAFASYDAGQAASRPARRASSRAFFLIANVAVIAGFLVFVSLFEAPAHLHGADQRRHLAPPPGARRPRQDPRHGHGERHRGHRLRRRQDRGLHLEADARLRHLHRVRPMPVGLPGMDHGQAAEPEARHHGPARQHVRLGRPAPRQGRGGRRGRDVGAHAPSTPTSCGAARPAAAASSSARSTSSTSTPSSTCAATRS